MEKTAPTQVTEPAIRADHFIDITAETCPMTFVRTKLLLERMAPGEIAEVRLTGKEPLGNVPRSLAEHHHTVLDIVPEIAGVTGPDAVHRLFVKKGDRALRI